VAARPEPSPAGVPSAADYLRLADPSAHLAGGDGLLPAAGSAQRRRAPRRAPIPARRAPSAHARAFHRPVLLAWGEDDRLFPLSLAERLAELLPDARIVSVAGARTLVPEDQPEMLAKLVAEFAG
jgi:pimeloyl-ACP methyl ester carboxylesterase